MLAATPAKKVHQKYFSGDRLRYVAMNGIISQRFFQTLASLGKVTRVRMRQRTRPSAVTGNDSRSSWHRLAEAEQVALAVFKPSRSLTHTLARLVPLNIGDPHSPFSGRAGRIPQTPPHAL